MSKPRSTSNLNFFCTVLKEAGHRGDKLTVYLLACMANLAIIVITKHGVWTTFDGSVNEADVILVYLGRSVFCDTVLAKSIKHEFKVCNHEDGPLDPNQHCTRSMTGAKTTPTPIPIPTESEPKRKQKCTKRKLKVKIVKKKEFKIRRRWCMTRRCSLCPKKFKSTKELNDHISNEHNYKFLCKFCPCHKAYNSKLSADWHMCHHSPGRYQCDKCSKMFHEKYVLESHLNTHTGHGYKCTYPNVTESTSCRSNIIGICSPTPSTRKKSAAMFVIRLLTLRNILMSTLRSMRISYQRNAHTVGKGFGGVQALGSTSD